MSDYDELIAKNRKKSSSLKRQLTEVESSYRSLLRAQAEELRDTMPFISMNPIDAMRQVLDERGRAIPREELTNIIVAGGVTYGKKRDEKNNSNVESSFNTNLRLGNIVEIDGLIGYPSWTEGGSFKEEYLPE